LTIAPTDLAKFRSLATEVRAEGLLDATCIERLRQEAETQTKKDALDALNQKRESSKKRAEWKRQHPHHKGPAPIFPKVAPVPPLDPFSAFVQLEGVGTVESTSDYVDYRSNARCMTRATLTLWNMVMGL
jgi:hypothetical protein